LDPAGLKRPALQNTTKATTIDALFGPLAEVHTEGRVWTYQNNQLKSVPVRLGISDGQTTELIAGDLPPDSAVVTNITTGAETKSAAAATPASGLFGGLAGPGGNFNRGGGAGRR
jgi:multidrug efflux pump subunit AcrA (membrane-fusion protein)